ncbi:hypothetical protein Tco_1407032 [Tanacetum coccineum]
MVLEYHTDKLKGKSFDEIQKLFDKEMKRVNTFVAMGSEVQENKEKKEEGREEIAKGSRKKMLGRKRAVKEQHEESSKKQKVEEERVRGDDREDLNSLEDSERECMVITKRKMNLKRVTTWKLIDSSGVHFVRNRSRIGINKLGSYDVIVGMDWMTEHRAEVVCYEKYIRVPYGNYMLIVQGERSGVKNDSRFEVISSIRTQKYIDQGCQEEAFQLLKQKLCAAPVLATPEAVMNFYVYCDDSIKGLCGTNAKDVVIPYASK